MTPAARLAAAMSILDQILDGTPAEPALLRWARSSRFAGSGDRAAIRDLVYDAIRNRRSYAALGGGESGRSLILGRCRAENIAPETLFTGEGHAPPALSDDERAQPVIEPLPRDLPDWIWPLWQTSLGEHAEAVAQAMRHRAPIWLRANPRRAPITETIRALSEAGIEVAPASQTPLALRVISGERRIARSEPYLDGRVELQDLSPQLACLAVPISDGMRVLDYCAGGGGKSLALAARVDACFEAHDRDAGRMSDLPKRAARAGITVSLAATGELRGGYDLVVADVPCSGSGSWRRDPEGKWRLDQEGLQRVMLSQDMILDDVVPLVGKGGCLAYMTCSLLRCENHERIKAFLTRHNGFHLVQEQQWSPVNASDGFYLAVLKKA